MLAIVSRPARRSLYRLRGGSRRYLLTLAIETSCDDTSVALVHKYDGVSVYSTNCAQAPLVSVHFHQKITSNNLVYRGVHPIVSLDSHQQNLTKLIKRSLAYLPAWTAIAKSAPLPVMTEAGMLQKQKPDFISVTRGPGMRSNLSTGLDTAKGLCVAWDVPLVGVNHMQAHALTPRLVSAMELSHEAPAHPRFPFLSLLVSGGHTMLIHSKSLNDHPTLATTVDIAIGDAIDKIARCILPESILSTAKSTMYGPILESFAFPNGETDYSYTAPPRRQEELARRASKWGWSFGVPFAESNSGAKSKAMLYTFSGLCSTASRLVENRTHELGIDERQEMAREAMRVAFEHLASRVVLGLGYMAANDPQSLNTIQALVVSGGVAANKYLRHVLRAFLDVRGYSHVKLVFPPLSLCTDNAAMIGWAGIEMFEEGWTTDLSCQALRKWSLDPAASDGGILGASAWLHDQTKQEQTTKQV